MINPNINICKKVWRLTEMKEIKKIARLALPHIEYRQSFYIIKKKRTHFRK